MEAELEELFDFEPMIGFGFFGVEADAAKDFRVLLKVAFIVKIVLIVKIMPFLPAPSRSGFVLEVNFILPMSS